MSTEGSGENAAPAPSLPGAPEQTYLFLKPKGHSRSISHGGTPIPVGGTLASARPSALKSATRGHQRAFSHGQIGEGGRAPPSGTSQPGHSRAGSRTDFILPPGHREQPPPAVGVARQHSQRASGHSRQASRTDSIYTLRRSSGPPPWRRAVHWVLRREPPTEDSRHLIVVPNHLVPDKTPHKEHPNGHRCHNKVRTTKYTLLSFLPKNLLEQFHRIANLYFIFILLLNWFPAINAFGKELAMLPLLFVLSVTAIKDLFEDRRRHLSDKRINNSFCRVYKRAVDQYVSTRWRDVRVGDIVHLSNNEPVPADMVLLRSSDRAGCAYLDTCNLDGENNLKQRLVAPGFRDKQMTFSASKFVSMVEVDRPSTKIYRFHGSISHPDGTRVPLTTDNLLLRDCFIKNTSYVEGIVVYAGHETKAMLNNGGPRYKRSKLERTMNTDIVWCVLVLLLLCCVGAVCHKISLERLAPLSLPADRRPLFVIAASQSGYSPAIEALVIFWTFVIVLQVMIPISLYVTIEMTKLLQVYHIHNDVEMYDPTTDTRVQCRALNVTEELGQIRYLFSDKTGTLTENKMIFRRCCIDGVDYEHPPGPPATPNADLPPIVTPITEVSPNPRLLEFAAASPEGGHAQRVREFLVVLAVCNTVAIGQPHIDDSPSANTEIDLAAGSGRQANGVRTTEKYARLAESRSTTPSPPPTSSTPRIRLPRLTRLPFKGRDRIAQLPSARTANGTEDADSTETQMRRYEAESPDELALAEAALAYGIELRNRTPDELELGMRGELTRLRLLRIQKFDATRKCMSVALRAGNGTVVLYVKGADSTVLSALAPARDGSAEAASAARTRTLLDEYSRAGLRTLAVARRTMAARAWDEWVAAHARAGEGGEGRERRLRESLARLESGLTLLGATGVEDRLQEAVPRTVRALLDAGIVVWVLTGDKPETAVNVAYSAELFSQRDRLMFLMSRNKEHAESTIQSYLDASLLRDGGGRGLVVDGKTLTYILDRRSGLVLPFLSLARRCSAVLCCRATPLQKAYIVKAVKEELGVTTLAVGDGANDVSMIQTADVGIGLSGQEGMQAVMASDFALSRFKYLERFLLVHGHWCYDRLARMILYFFLKNATFVFMVFWYQIYNGFSASLMIDQLHIMTYNMMFTAFPPIAIGAYDRVAPAPLLLERPGLYRASRLGRSYQPHSYWTTLAESIYISLIVFYANLYTFWGSDADIWLFGLSNMTCCLVVMTLYVAIETRSWTIIHVVCLVGSLGAFFVLTLIYNSMCPAGCLGMPSTYWVMHKALADPRYYLVLVLATTASLAPRLAWRGMHNSLWPGALGRAVIARRRKTRMRLPYAAAYHTPTSSAHVYRSTDEGALQKATTEVIAVA